MNLDITLMSERHLDAVLEIERSSFISPWSRDLFVQELETEIGQSFIAVLAGGDVQAVAGYLCCWVAADECNILKLACHPRYRRRGIGTLLLERGLREAWRKGARVVSLEVRPSNLSAVSFYSACGFAPAGQRKGYYHETGEDAIVMLLHLGEDFADAERKLP